MRRGWPGQYEPGINDLSTTHPCESTAAAKSDHSRPGLATAGDDAGLSCSASASRGLLNCYSLCHLTIPGQLQRPDASSILQSFSTALAPLVVLSVAGPEPPCPGFAGPAE